MRRFTDRTATADPEARRARFRLGAAAVVVVGLIAAAAVLVGTQSSAAPHAAGSHADRPIDHVADDVQSATTTRRSITDSDDAEDVHLRAAQTMSKLSDPVRFGEAYVRALFTYDTTRQTLAERRAALLAWTPSDGWFSDAESMLNDFLGTPAVWDAAKAVHQRQSVVIERAWVPDSIKAKMHAEPAAIARTHWPCVVTVSLVRRVRGDLGSNADLPVTVSVIVSCPPGRSCVALAPGRSVIEH